MDRSVLSEYIKLYGKGVEASILTSRGCAYSKCSYCTVKPYENLQAGCFYRQRSIENIVKEIELLHNNYGIVRFNFEDDNFILPGKTGRERLIKFCDIVNKLPFKIEFTFFCRVDSVDVELFGKLKEAGLRSIYLGIESFYDYTLNYFEKGVKFADMTHAFEKLSVLGFSASVKSKYRIHVGYITWHPKVSIDELKHNLYYIRKYNIPIKVFTRKLALYKGSKLYEQYSNNKKLYGEYNWEYDILSMTELEKKIVKGINYFMDKRDQLRTIEKFAIKNGLVQDKIINKAIDDIDDLCYEYIAEVLDNDSDVVVKKYYYLFDEYIEKNKINDIIKQGYTKLNLDLTQKNFFRK